MKALKVLGAIWVTYFAGCMVWGVSMMFAGHGHDTAPNWLVYSTLGPLFCAVAVFGGYALYLLWREVLS